MRTLWLWISNLAFLLMALPLVAQEEPPVYMGRAFLFEAELDRGVELGWLAPDYSADEVMAQIEDRLNDRLLRTGRFVEGVARSEAGNRVTVTFVGKQAEPIEQMLIQGISSAGRLSLHVVASADDLASCQTTREAETERLHAWMSNNADVLGFDRLSRSEGGPCEGMTWMASQRGAVETEGPAVLVLRQPVVLVRPGDVASFEFVAPSETTKGLDLQLEDAALAAIQHFAEEAGNAEIAFAVNGEVAWIWPAPLAAANPFRVQGPFDMDEFRAIVMSFAAEPLPAPLRFVETTMRELPNVKIRDSPTAID